METRCKKCSRLFFRGEIKVGAIEIKCPKCGYVQKIIETIEKSLTICKGL